jgi:hypothetical protein
MAAISSSAGFQAATQAAFQQMKVQQARQNADRAEQVARAMAAKAGEAQQVADRAQESARSMTLQSDQAQTAAGQARQGVAMIQSVGNMQVRLGNTVSQVAEKVADVTPAASTEPVSVPTPAPVPVVNTSGQVTGTLVNTTA